MVDARRWTETITTRSNHNSPAGMVGDLISAGHGGGRGLARGKSRTHNLGGRLKRDTLRAVS